MVPKPMTFSQAVSCVQHGTPTLSGEGVFLYTVKRETMISGGSNTRYEYKLMCLAFHVWSTTWATDTQARSCHVELNNLML